jgi:hypothetical protein
MALCGGRGQEEQQDIQSIQRRARHLPRSQPWGKKIVAYESSQVNLNFKPYNPATANGLSACKLSLSSSIPPSLPLAPCLHLNVSLFLSPTQGQPEFPQQLRHRCVSQRRRGPPRRQRPHSTRQSYMFLSCVAEFSLSQLILPPQMLLWTRRWPRRG